jgi:D-aminoacyl-tRNA deacylase
VKYAIVTSTKDLAGMNIRDKLMQKLEKTKESYNNHPIYKKNNISLYTIDEETIEANHLDELKAEFIIFATRHKAASGTPTFSCHAPGNWDEAQYGGENQQLNYTSALLIKKAFLTLENNNNLEWEISMEATHHGPMIKTPCIFIEIGSTEKEWNNEDAGEIMAKTILDITSTLELENQKIGIGIGGNHYCANFNKLLHEDIALSHICPKHNLEHLNITTLKQAIERTKEKVDYIILDWKGLGPHKEKIKELTSNLNIEIKRTKELTST